MASSDRSAAGSRRPAARSSRSLTRTSSNLASTSSPRRTARSPSGNKARITSVRARALDASGRRRRRCLRSALDSGSRTASFTIADESRYVTLSAFIGAEASEDGGRRLLAGLELEWLRQILIRGWWFEIARGPKARGRARVRERGQDRDRTTPIGDLEGLALLDLAHELTRPLSQLSDSDRTHVLLIALLSGGWSRNWVRIPLGVPLCQPVRRSRSPRTDSSTEIAASIASRSGFAPRSRPSANR